MDRDTLCAHAASGGRFDLLLFWGHTPKQPGAVDAACLSQWYPSPFVVAGHRYDTAEHWMMAEKARLFGDAEALDAILSAPSPRAAKALGRRVRGFTQEGWEAARSDIVTAGSTHKFGQDDALGAFLKGTGDRVLVEASRRDRVWGIGLAATDPRALDPRRWRGLNLLGFALMEARAHLDPGP